MKKTKLMATITQTLPGSVSHIERRVYVDEYERLYAKINGQFFSIIYLSLHGNKVVCW